MIWQNAGHQSLMTMLVKADTKIRYSFRAELESHRALSYQQGNWNAHDMISYMRSKN